MKITNKDIMVGNIFLSVANTLEYEHIIVTEIFDSYCKYNCRVRTYGSLSMLSSSCYYDVLRPIEISDKLLMGLCQFRENSKGMYYLEGEDFYLQYDKKEKCWYVLLCSDSISGIFNKISKINYIHQIQNMMYLLFGKHFEIYL